MAALLSLLMPGVGHAYCGNLARGLAVGLLYGVAIPAVLGLLAYYGPASTVLFGFFMVAATIGVVVAATVDAGRLARRTRPDYQPKVYNRPSIYLLLGVLIQGSSIGYALHVRGSLFEAFRVPAASEYPNIVPEDRILVDKTAYRQTAPSRGDTVLFKPPNENWHGHYIKRVVAVAGDTVEMKDGDLYVNGEKLPRRAIARSDINAAPVEVNGQVLEGDFFLEENGRRKYTIFLAAAESQAALDYAAVVVPAHHCFVLGDNRNRSRDSRHFGPISYATIAGRADYVYWPADTWMRFGSLH
ncbi:MAG: signal peptidase I [Phycisphaerales bacterium]|nr:MAG: signal peptidase I [Phycisphaerales bacterium]